MLTPSVDPIPDFLLDKILLDLGPLLPALKRGDLFVTGGYLTRLSCGLAVGADIDLVGSVDGYAYLRGLLNESGYHLSDDVQSTGFRKAWADAGARDADFGVWFREKWDHVAETPRLSIDCLVLQTKEHFDNAKDVTGAALDFIDTYDCHAPRQLFGWVNGAPVWFRTAESEQAIRAHVPGWVDGAITHSARRARWDRLLPGLPPMRGPA